MTFGKRLCTLLYGVSDGEYIKMVRNKLSVRPQLDAEAFAYAYFSEEKQMVAKKLWKITKEHSVADITGITPDDAFVSDLKMDNLDSMSLVEFVVHLEADFKINIPEGRIQEIRTFGQLVDEICRLKNDGIVSDPSTSSG